MNLYSTRCVFGVCLVVTISMFVYSAAMRLTFPEKKMQVLLTDFERHEVQVNTFSSSSQSAPAIASFPDGGFAVVWQSRRQQAGTYGIYLQRYSKTGKSIGPENQVNLFTSNMQMNPAIAIDSNGTAWVAWESFGQDGSFNAIVARRFDGEHFAGGDEILVNQITKGNQSDVIIATDNDGTATFFWVTATADAKRKQIVGRSFDSIGNANGNEFEVSDSTQHQNLPSVSADGTGRIGIVWSEQDRFGRPAGVFGRLIDSAGRSLCDTFAVNSQESASQIEPSQIEPSISMTASGNFAVAWLRASGSEYEALVRNFDKNGQPVHKPVQASPPGSKYVSGVSIVAGPGGQFAALWNHQTDSTGHDINISAQLIDSSGKHLGDMFSVNSNQKGRHRLASTSGKNRVSWSPNNDIKVAWYGQGKADSSSVNVTVLAEIGSDFGFEKAVGIKPTVPIQLTARPHEPPHYDPKLVSKEPFGGFDPLGPPGIDFGFTAINATGWNPPDPSIAVGPNHIVAMTNGAIAFFTKAGTLTFSDQIEDSFGFWGSVGATGFVFDPEVIFDTHSDRFIAMANERSGGRSYFLLAVSDNDDPNGNWFRYRLDVTDISDPNIDSPNLAVDDEIVYLTADFFLPDAYLVYMLRKSDLLVGAAPLTTHLFITGSHSLGIPLIYDENAPAFYMIQAFEQNTFSSLRLHAVSDQLGMPQRVTTDISVPSYGHPQDPPQQGTATRPELFEARFWSCVYRDGSLWAVHHHSPNSSGLVRARWYEIAMNGWPTSGQSPVLVQSGELTPVNQSGQPSATFFPSIWVDELGNAAITTSRSSSSEFISMWRAVRSPSDPLGTFQPVQLVRASTTPFTTNGRWGDYSGTTSDPGAPGTFWGINEFAETNGIWQTYIAQYVVENATTILPESTSTENGTIVAGQASSVHESDDVYLDVLSEPPSTPGGHEIVINFTGNTVDTEFSTLRIMMETSANSVNLIQSIEMFDFVAKSFEVVDTRNATLSDSQIEIELSDNVSRFVTPDAGLIFSRVKFKSSGPVLFFPWQSRIDQFVWQIVD